MQATLAAPFAHPQILPQLGEAAPSHPPVIEQTTTRYDIYAGIHKGLRALMADTLITMGRLDPHDAIDVQAALRQTRDLLDLCRLHLHDEDTFVHPALEACKAGFSARIASEHIEHRREIDLLAQWVEAVEAEAGNRVTAVGRLYRELSLFVAHNFEHMAYEETRHNETLWSHYSDLQLLEIEHAIVESIDPQTMGQFLRWMLPSMNHPERAALLTDMRKGAPPQAFDGVVQMTRGLVSRAEWRKLSESLALA